MKSNFLPTVFKASENLASNKVRNTSISEALSQPIVCATLIISAVDLLIFIKKVTLISARILSLQINPFAPVRSTSNFFTEISIISILCKTGTTSPAL